MAGELYWLDAEGGTDGSAYTTVITGASVVATTNFSAADAAHGSMGIRTSGASAAGIKLPKGSSSLVYSGSIYAIPRTVSTGGIRIITFQSTANAVIGSFRFLQSTGKFDIANNAAASVVASAQSWTLNSVARIDWQFDGSVSGQYTLTIKIFATDAEATTPDDTISYIFTTATVFGQFQIGQPGNTANVLGFDDVRVYDSLLWAAPLNPTTPPPPPPAGEFYYETFETGTNGTAVTSGGDISAVTATTTYSAADATHGTLGVRTSGATGAGVRIQKSTLSNTHTGSIYVIPDTVITTGGAPRAVVFTNSASSFIGSIRLNNASGLFDIGGPSNLAVSTGTTSWLAGRTYRLDWQFDGSVSGTYNITVKVFGINPEGTTPDETITGTISSALVFSQFIFGQPGNASNVLGFDSVRIYDTTAAWPAPINPGAPPPPPPPGNPGTWNFSWVGGTTSTSFSVSTYVTAGTSLACKASTASDMSAVVATVSSVTPDATTGLAKFDMTGLSPYTQYYYQIYDTPSGGTQTAIGEIGMAKTLKTSGSPQSFNFAFGGCVTNNADVHAAFDDIRLNYQPDFMIHMGDFHYQNPTSTVDTDHINFWKGQIAGAAGYHNLIRDVPMFYIRSDHDAGPGDNADSDNASNQASINGYKKIVPYPASGYLADTRSPTAGLYFSFAIGRVRFIFVDIRNMDRSPGLSADSSSKTMLGATQLAWLKARLLDSEPVKVIVSDVAWSGPYSTSNGEDKWWSYNSERAVISSFIAAHNLQVIMLTSDTHCLLCDNGGLNQWGGFPIFGAAPFANVGGGRNLTYYQGIYNTTQTVQGSQYGRVAVTDDGTNITFVYQGYDVIHATNQITQTVTYSSVAPPQMSFTLWDGTTEQPLTGTIWNGTSEVRIANDSVNIPVAVLRNAMLNPSNEAGGSSWSASSQGTVTQGSTEYAKIGTTSMKFVPSGTTTVGGTYTYPIENSTDPGSNGHARYAVAAGDTYDYIFTAKAAASNTNPMRLMPRPIGYYWDGAAEQSGNIPATYFDSSGAAGILLNPGDELNFAGRTVIPASLTTGITIDGILPLIYVYGATTTTPATVGDIVYIDRVMLVRNAFRPLTTDDFFYGGTSDATWAGTVNASSSTHPVYR